MKRCLLLLAGLTLPASTLSAQLCRGRPMTRFSALATRTEAGNNGGEIGLRTSSRFGLSGNVDLPADQPNGSRVVSYGGRIFGTRPSGSFCAMTGLQMGMAHLINAEGLHVNMRLRQFTVPVGFGIGQAIPIGRAASLFLFGVPQATFTFRKATVYSRSDTTEVSEAPSGLSFEGGAGLTVGPLLSRFSMLKVRDNPWMWTLGVGLAL